MKLAGSLPKYQTHASTHSAWLVILNFKLYEVFFALCVFL